MRGLGEGAGVSCLYCSTHFLHENPGVVQIGGEDLRENIGASRALQFAGRRTGRFVAFFCEVAWTRGGVPANGPAGWSISHTSVPMAPGTGSLADPATLRKGVPVVSRPNGMGALVAQSPVTARMTRYL